MAAFEIIALDTATPQLRAPGAGDTYLAPRSMVVNPGTLTTAVSPFEINATWNNAGVTFPGALKVNVTDTASDVFSMLMDFQVGGVSRMSLTKGGVLTAFVAINCAVGNITAGNSIATSNGFVWVSGDLSLFRDTAGVMALRNGANAQTFRNYGTWTDPSNGRWLQLSMTTAGVATIQPTGNGTGASGNVLHISGLPTSNPGPGILWNDTGTVKVGT
jgi:hypothetical protein